MKAPAYYDTIPERPLGDFRSCGVITHVLDIQYRYRRRRPPLGENVPRMQVGVGVVVLRLNPDLVIAAQGFHHFLSKVTNEGGVETSSETSVMYA